jgi:hypothetical protein
VEVLGMLLADILDPEIIDDKDAQDRVSVVLEVSRNGGDRSIAILGEMDNKTFVGKDTGMWKTIHAFVDLNVVDISLIMPY